MKSLSKKNSIIIFVLAILPVALSSAANGPFEFPNLFTLSLFTVLNEQKSSKLKERFEIIDEEDTIKLHIKNVNPEKDNKGFLVLHPDNGDTLTLTFGNFTIEIFAQGTTGSICAKESKIDSENNCFATSSLCEERTFEKKLNLQENKRKYDKEKNIFEIEIPKVIPNEPSVIEYNFSNIIF